MFTKPLSRFCFALLLVVTQPGAAPFVPQDDARVLETLRDRPSNPVFRETRELRAQPRNLALALRLARRYIELSRREADPRYLGYAQAALAPWWNLPSPPLPVLVLRATILQSNHHFAAALADLAQALRKSRITRKHGLRARRYCRCRANTPKPDKIASDCAASPAIWCLPCA